MARICGAGSRARSTREVDKEMNASHHVIWCIANGTAYKEVECED